MQIDLVASIRGGLISEVKSSHKDDVSITVIAVDPLDDTNRVENIVSLPSEKAEKVVITITLHANAYEVEVDKPAHISVKVRLHDFDIDEDAQEQGEEGYSDEYIRVQTSKDKEEFAYEYMHAFFGDEDF